MELDQPEIHSSRKMFCAASDKPSLTRASLTPQEIRNAIYRGVDPRLNELLLKIANTELFRNLTALSPGRLDELYDQELVLRFFAFYNNAENVDDNMERFLNSFMEKTVKDPDFDYERYEALLMRVLELVSSANNAKLFRNHRGLFVPAYFEGILIGVAQNIDKYTDNIDLINIKITELKSDAEFRGYSGSASNSSSRIRNRLRRINQIFR